jgi:hypothetical protein
MSLSARRQDYRATDFYTDILQTTTDAARNPQKPPEIARFNMALKMQ